MLGWRWNGGGGGEEGAQRRDEHWEKGLIKAGTDDKQMRRRMRRKKHSALDLWRSYSISDQPLDSCIYKEYYIQKFVNTRYIPTVVLHSTATVCTQGVNHFKGVTGIVWKIASDHSEPFLNLWLTINNKQNPRPPTSINTSIARWETAS